LALIPCFVACADTTGILSPTGQAGPSEWTNPLGALSDGSGEAECSAGLAQGYAGFDLSSIPAGATIDSVVVYGKGRAQGSDATIDFGLSTDSNQTDLETAAQTIAFPCIPFVGCVTGTTSETFVIDSRVDSDFTNYLTVIGQGVSGTALIDWIYIEVNYTPDTTPPTCVLSDNHPDLIVRDADTVAITATFDEDMAPAPTISINVSGGSGSDISAAAMSGSGATWTYSWNVPAGNTGMTATATVAGTDVAGNPYAGSESIVYTIDNTAPTGVLSHDHAYPVARDADTVVFTATFNEDMAPTDPPEILLDGWDCGGGPVWIDMNGSGTTWTYSWDVPAGDCTYFIVVEGYDVAGNWGNTDNYFDFDIDNTAPTVVLSDDHADLVVRNADTVVITATFDTPVIPAPTISIDVSGGAGSDISAAPMSASYDPYTYPWTYSWNVPAGNSGETATVTVAGADYAGNPYAGSDSIVYTIDNDPPAVIAVDVNTDPMYEGDLTQQVTVTFDEAMDTGTDPTIAFTNGIAPVGTWSSHGDGAWSGGDTVWIETFTLTDNDEEMRVAIDITGAKDSAGNAQDDYSPVWEFVVDTVKPQVSAWGFTDPVYEGDLTQQVTVSFDDVMTTNGTADPQIVFSAGTWTPGAGWWQTTSEWRQTFALTDNDEEITDVSVTVSGTKDDAGNPQEPSISDIFDIDTVKPVVSDVAVDTDPAFEGDLTQQVTVTFSVQEFGIPQIAFSAGTWTAGAGSWSGGNLIWIQPFTLTDNDESISGITIDVKDQAGNDQEGYTPTPLFDIDTVKPSIVMVDVDTDPMYEGDLIQRVTVTFDEAMDTGTDPTITFTNGVVAVGIWSSHGDGAWSAGDTVWTETFTLTDNEEEMQVGIDVTGAQDAAGNSQEDYAPMWEFVVDTVKPQVSAWPFDTDPVCDGDLTQQVGVSFDDVMTTDGTADPQIVFSAGTWTPGAGSWTTTMNWSQTFTLTDNEEQVADVSVTVTGTKDDAGNPQEPSVSDVFDIDTRNPLVASVAPASLAEADAGSMTIDITLDEAMSEVDNVTVTVQGINDSPIPVTYGSWPSSTVWRGTFPFTDDDETVTIAYYAISGAQDLAGNTMIALGSRGANNPLDVDTEKPTATVTVDHTTVAGGSPIFEGSLTLTVTVAYDEDMDTSTTPTITLENATAARWTGATGGSWGGTTDTYTATFTHDGVEEPTLPAAMITAFARVASTSGATDLAGNTDVGDDSNPFDIDTRKPEVPPTVGSVTVDTNPVYEGDLTQHIIVTFDEAMDMSTDPTISFSHGTWATPGGSWTSALVWAETFTLTDNDEEYYSLVSDIVTVDVTGGRDAAGNNQENYGPQTEFDIDTLQPTIADATSSTYNGCYTTGASINISLTFSEDVELNSDFLELVFDVGGARAATYHLGLPSWGTLTDTASGTYVVASDENSCDLTLSSYTTTVSSTLLDWAGNVIDFQLPAAGSNIADHKDIFVDTTIPVAVQDPDGDEDRSGSNDVAIIGVWEDSGGQYRLAVPEDTTVKIDVGFNDTDQPCTAKPQIYDIPQPPVHGSASFLNPVGSITYSPNPGYLGPDEFTYRILDTCGNVSQEARVYLEIVVRPAPMPQLIGGDEDLYLLMCSNSALEFTCAIADLYIPEVECRAEVVAGPSHGLIVEASSGTPMPVSGWTTTALESAEITLRYIPSAGYVGSEILQLAFSDPYGGYSTALVDILVNECPGTGAAIIVTRGLTLSLLVPLTFEMVLSLGLEGVVLECLADGTCYPRALGGEWCEEIGCYTLRVDTGPLLPGMYRLTMPLGNGETVTLSIEVVDSL